MQWHGANLVIEASDKTVLCHDPPSRLSSYFRQAFDANCIHSSQMLGECENCLFSIAVLTCCVFIVQQKINVLLYAECVMCKQICVTVLSIVSV